MIDDDRIRPRLVLATTLLPDGEAGETALREALDAGDVASVLIDPADRQPGPFQDFAERLVPVIQAAGAAAIVAGDTRCAGRVRADGFHDPSGSVPALREAVGRFAPRLIVGASGFTTRHDALEAGECMPDYLFFGKLGADAAPEPLRRNLELAEWWASIVEIPCIVQGGSDLASLPAAVATRAEFIALSSAVFADLALAGERVRAAERLIDAAMEEAAA
ncbi:thiamine phosphate synthase [Aureimonas flava]|uniref:Thiamine phosphate synthase n=1 Tax=Aureimonas flava TaxID=2320271 RepID=A0A3A1WIV9_9HYPH|nr:thiamine phosphate synthase [Aureimonas flava]RIY00924.1 thiamine phosphate synthase [Aureimonas flava]